jgi:hypothetical protein
MSAEFEKLVSGYEREYKYAFIFKQKWGDSRHARNAQISHSLSLCIIAHAFLSLLSNSKTRGINDKRPCRRRGKQTNRPFHFCSNYFLESFLQRCQERERGVPLSHWNVIFSTSPSHEYLHHHGHDR